MSLKAFHVVFVIISTIFTVGFGLWAILSYRHTGNVGHLWLGIGSVASSVALAVYFRWFLRKLKNESYL